MGKKLVRTWRGDYKEKKFWLWIMCEKNEGNLVLLLRRLSEPPKTIKGTKIEGSSTIEFVRWP